MARHGLERRYGVVALLEPLDGAQAEPKLLHDVVRRHGFGAGPPFEKSGIRARSREDRIDADASFERASDFVKRHFNRNAVELLRDSASIVLWRGNIRKQSGARQI